MHGQQRDKYKAKQRDPTVQLAQQKKAEKWKTLVAQARSSQELRLPLTSKLLRLNPDPMDLWNLRKEAATTNQQEELKLSEAALMANPKSYGAWLHRKWTLVAFPSTSDKLQDELALTATFLDLDERNFHCWNYRRFVVKQLLRQHQQSCKQTSGGNQPAEVDDLDWCQEEQIIIFDTTDSGSSLLDLPLESSSLSAVEEILQTEWDFSTKKILHNFSNGSAFHHRCLLLPWKRPSEEEWELVQNAIFTEPDDQTAWWYSEVLSQLGVPGKEQFTTSVRELAEEMSESKWVLLGLYSLLDDTEKTEKDRLLHLLMEIDPDRLHRYSYLLKTRSSHEDN